MHRISSFLLSLALISSLAVAQKDGSSSTGTLAPPPLLVRNPDAGPVQPLDEGYTQQIHKFTTAPYFSTELVDHLPATNLPTPEKVLGHIAGAPDVLDYAEDIYRYLRELEKATPRVKVLTIGQTEEGREIVMALISDEQNITRRDEFRRMAARLADPRGITQADADYLLEVLDTAFSAL